jgi:hypothetical protein
MGDKERRMLLCIKKNCYVHMCLAWGEREMGAYGISKLLSRDVKGELSWQKKKCLRRT